MVYKEGSFTTAGNEILVADTPAGRLGLTVCYDLRFPELYQLLRFVHNAQVLLVPSAFTKVTGAAHWEILLRAQAIETQCFVHVHMKRRPMNELPKTDEAIAQWCRDIFMEKDALLDRRLAQGSFGEKDYKPIGRPVKSLLVRLVWSALMSTWKGVAFTSLALFLVTACMQAFIMFSQSERSRSAKAAQARVKKS